MTRYSAIAYFCLLGVVGHSVYHTGLLWPLYALLLTPFFTRLTVEREEVKNLREAVERMEVEEAFIREAVYLQGYRDGQTSRQEENKECVTLQ